MSGQTLSSLLLAASVALLAGALVTLLPYSSRMVSELGYYTLCPFAPYSTLTLLFFAGLAWVVRGHINAQSK